MKKNILWLYFLMFTIVVQAQENFCLNFDGVDDYIHLGDVNDLGTTDFTIEVWIFIDDESPEVDRIISKGLTFVGVPPNAGYSIRAQRDAPDEVELLIGNFDGSSQRVVHDGLTTNTWHHVAGVREGVNLSLYLDGDLVKEEQTSTVFNVDTNMPLTFGTLDREISQDGFADGKIDEVRIWNIAKTQEEIQLNMDCAIDTPTDGLIAAYNFNEASGDMVSDASGFDNTGDFIDSPLWETCEIAPICLIDDTEELEIEVLKLYPNPTTSDVFLSLDLTGSPFEIFDSSGKLVTANIINARSISISHLPKGMYWFRIKERDTQYFGKMVKQ